MIQSANAAAAAPSPAALEIPDDIPTTLLDRLREIAINRPQSLSELAGISGVGDRKLEQYGAAILELVAEAG